MGSRRATRHCRSGLAAHQRWFAVVSLLGATLATPAAALPRQPDPPTRLVLDPGLFARLRTLAAGLHHEIVLCLTGSVEGETAVATGFVMPDPHRSDSDGASFGPCPNTPVAIWHNHPLDLEERLGMAGSGAPSYARPRGDPSVSPRDLCALSETDIRTTAREGYPFVVVAVDGETWCWWTRDQVLALAKRRTARGDPVPGQIAPSTPPAGSRERSYQTP